MADGNYGGFWVRVLAYLVDSVICLTLLLLIAAGAAMLGGVGAALATPLMLVGPILYWAILQSSARQATFGKSLLGMKVTDASGARLSFLRSLARELAKIVSSIPMMLGFLLAAFTGRKQALHDMIASTLVTREAPGHFVVALVVGVLGWIAPIGLVMAVGVGLVAGLMGGMAGSLDQAMKEGQKQVSMESAPAPRRSAPAAPAAPSTAAKPAATPAGGDAEAALSAQLAGFDRPGTTRAGPAVLELSTTFNTSFWIKVYVPQSDDFTTDGAVAVTLIRVTDTSGGDLYDPKNSLETAFFQKVSLSPSASPAPHLGGTRQVNLAAGAGTSALSGAEGMVRFKLASKLATASFAAADAGKSKAANGLEITLKSMKGKEAEIVLGGEGSRIVGMLGYDAGGGRVRASSTTTSGAQIKLNYDQPVSRLDVVVAERFVERSYPFTLSRASAAGPAAMAAAPAAPAVPPAPPEPGAAPKPAPIEPKVAAVPVPVAPAMRAEHPALVRVDMAPRLPGPKYNDIMSAVVSGDNAAVQELLAMGKWPDKPDSNGVTPLTVAVMRGDRVNAELLLKAGADPGRVQMSARARGGAEMNGLLESYSATSKRP